MEEKRKALIEHFTEKCSMAIEEAQQVADMNQALCDAMLVREVKFYFKKVDGTIREARGTLRSEVMPEVKGTGRPTGIDLQVYFDLDKQSLRSFKKANLVSYE